jgi:hypothetical protein
VPNTKGKEKRVMKEADRIEICKIITKMLDNARDGLYPTSTAYTELEHYVNQVRVQAVGWMHARACTMLDQGDDPRLADVPTILQHAADELN